MTEDNSLREVGPKEFFALKLPYQLALFWLPIIAGAISLGVFGYFLGSFIAPLFGVNPNAPIISQPNGHLFVACAAFLFAILGVVGMVAAYVLGCYCLTVMRGLDSRAFVAVLRGKAYPSYWF